MLRAASPSVSMIVERQLDDAQPRQRFSRGGHRASRCMPYKVRRTKYGSRRALRVSRRREAVTSLARRGPSSGRASRVTLHGDAEAVRRAARRRGRRRPGPQATTRPARSSRAWVVEAGSSSRWWVTVTTAGGAARRRATASAASSASRPGRSRPSAGSSSSSSGGWRIRARASSTRRRSPCEQAAKGWPAIVAQPNLGEEARRARAGARPSGARGAPGWCRWRR